MSEGGERGRGESDGWRCGAGEMTQFGVRLVNVDSSENQGSKDWCVNTSA